MTEFLNGDPYYPLCTELSDIFSLLSLHEEGGGRHEKDITTLTHLFFSLLLH